MSPVGPDPTHLRDGLIQGLRPVVKELHDNGRDGRKTARDVGRWLASAIVFSAAFVACAAMRLEETTKASEIVDTAATVTHQFWRSVASGS